MAIAALGAPPTAVPPHRKATALRRASALDDGRLTGRIEIVEREDLVVREQPLVNLTWRRRWVTVRDDLGRCLASVRTSEKLMHRCLE
jgi:hypothetical protein